MSKSWELRRCSKCGHEYVRERRLREAGHSDGLPCTYCASPLETLPLVVWSEAARDTRRVDE